MNDTSQEQDKPLHDAGLGKGRSFLSHLRPVKYPIKAVSFPATLYLGFLALFFFVLEGITGIILMFYYIPTPTGAYDSVVRLGTEIPFGWLIRDLHRLGGECMVAVVLLHMLWIFLRGNYKHEGRYAWFSGIGLLGSVLILAFSGYLLPWDQLAYWAVTIGTSLAENIPLIGHDITLLLRGGAELGQDGLLRFYLIHIVCIPTVGLLFLGMHYYRVTRYSTARLQQAHGHNATQKVAHKIPTWPNIVVLETLLSLLVITALVLISLYIYDAPLESHANPMHTPENTAAPWFFLWLQGALKLGDGMLITLLIFIVLPLLLFLLPYLDRGKKEVPLNKRFLAIPIGVVIVVSLGYLSQLGMHHHNANPQSASEVLSIFAPEEQTTPFHRLGFSNLPAGVFLTDQPPAEALPPAFVPIFSHFSEMVENLNSNEEISEASGALIIDPWQTDLLRITLRINWKQSGKDTPQSKETQVYLYQAGANAKQAGEKS